MAQTKGRKANFQADKEQAAKRVCGIIPIFKKLYPDAKTALDFKSPLELLIATILSAQSTDVQTNKITKDLFKKYKTAADFADAAPEQLQQDIHSSGFFRNKARNIQAACRKIIDDFDGSVPDNMKELVTLPGVGRKTANVILGNAFGVPGIACDTHVIRLSRRLQLSENHDPVKLEQDLADIIPKKHWTKFSHMLILHGRAVCNARKPKCQQCQIAKYCPAAGKSELW